MADPSPRHSSPTLIDVDGDIEMDNDNDTFTFPGVSQTEPQSPTHALHDRQQLLSQQQQQQGHNQDQQHTQAQQRQQLRQQQLQVSAQKQQAHAAQQQRAQQQAQQRAAEQHAAMYARPQQELHQPLSEEQERKKQALIASFQQRDAQQLQKLFSQPPSSSHLSSPSSNVPRPQMSPRWATRNSSSNTTPTKTQPRPGNGAKPANTMPTLPPGAKVMHTMSAPGLTSSGAAVIRQNNAKEGPSNSTSVTPVSRAELPSPPTSNSAQSTPTPNSAQSTPPTNSTQSITPTSQSTAPTPRTDDNGHSDDEFDYTADIEVFDVKNKLVVQWDGLQEEIAQRIHDYTEAIIFKAMKHALEVSHTLCKMNDEVASDLTKAVEDIQGEEAKHQKSIEQMRAYLRYLEEATRALSG